MADDHVVDPNTPQGSKEIDWHPRTPREALDMVSSLAGKDVPEYRQVFTVVVDCDDPVSAEVLKQSLIMGLDHYGPWGIYGDDVTVEKHDGH